ncbi:MAG: hypothetical protein LBS37_04820, partial [Treponema sp.]|nr:hypothetical protein [Treponema sp.]
CNGVTGVQTCALPIFSDWLRMFDGEERTFTELREAWENEVENAGPIADWRISDLPGGEEA